MVEQFIFYDKSKNILKDYDYRGYIRHDNSLYYNITPLWAAILCENLAFVQRLLRLSADPNVQDNNGNSCLMIACMGYNNKVSRAILECLLLSDKIEINAQNKLTGITALHAAVSNNDISFLMALLIDGNSNPRIKDNYGRTPLIMAALNGRLPMMHAMLKEFYYTDLEVINAFEMVIASQFMNHDTTVDNILYSKMLLIIEYILQYRPTFDSYFCKTKEFNLLNALRNELLNGRHRDTHYYTISDEKYKMLLKMYRAEIFIKHFGEKSLMHADDLLKFDLLNYSECYKKLANNQNVTVENWQQKCVTTIAEYIDISKNYVLEKRCLQRIDMAYLIHAGYQLLDSSLVRSLFIIPINFSLTCLEYVITVLDRYKEELADGAFLEIYFCTRIIRNLVKQNKTVQQTDMLKKYVKKLVELNPTERGHTLLHVCLYKEASILIIQCGAKIDVLNYRRETPLYSHFTFLYSDIKSKNEREIDSIEKKINLRCEVIKLLMSISKIHFDSRNYENETLLTLFKNNRTVKSPLSSFVNDILITNNLRVPSLFCWCCQAVQKYGLNYINRVPPHLYPTIELH